MGFIGKVGGQPELRRASSSPDVNVGLFITAVVAFLILAAVVYFFVVTPYTQGQGEVLPADAAGPTEAELLVQIRDLLATKA